MQDPRNQQGNVVQPDQGVRVMKTEIRKCYEIVIVDDDGKETGEPEYWYGNRKEAEQYGEKMLKRAMAERGEEDSE